MKSTGAKTGPNAPGPSSEQIQVLDVRNFQRARAVNLPRLRKVLRSVLRDMLSVEQFHLQIALVDAAGITRVNEQFLLHRGVTDVIAFNYGLPVTRPVKAVQTRRTTGAQALFPPGAVLHGEVLACVDEAVRQARRFRTTWQSELLRYLLHGVLHLCGFEDKKPVQRKHMKRLEDPLLRRVARQYDLDALGR